MKSNIENKKFQYWVINIRDYKYKIEYIEGKKNVCADLVSHLLCNCSGHNSDDRGELSGPDFTDKTFKINLIISININSKGYMQYDQQIWDKQCLTEDKRLPGCNFIEEESKKVQRKETLQNEMASQSANNKYIILENILYYWFKADTDLVIRLYVPEQLRKLVILEYHDYNGHMGIGKTYNAIKGTYYWSCMYE